MARSLFWLYPVEPTYCTTATIDGATLALDAEAVVARARRL